MDWHRSVLFLGLYLGAIATLVFLFGSYLSFLIFGTIVVILLEPVNQRVQRFVPNKVAASLLMTVLAVLLVLLPIGSVVYGLSGQIGAVKDIVAQANYTSIGDTVNSYLGTNIDLRAATAGALQRLQGVATQRVPGLIGSITDIVLNTFIMFFLIYYGFKEGRQLKQGLFSALPFDDQYIEALEKRGYDVLYGTLYGQLLVSILQGFLVGASFWAAGLSGPLVWGFITAILAFLPLLGTPIIWVPAAWVLWSRGEPATAIAFLAFNAVFSMNIDNVVRPKLIGDNARMHPLLVLLSILGGLQAFGFIGFIVGPVLTAVCILIIQFYVEDLDPAQHTGISPEDDGGAPQT